MLQWSESPARTAAEAQGTGLNPLQVKGLSDDQSSSQGWSAEGSLSISFHGEVSQPGLARAKGATLQLQTSRGGISWVKNALFRKQYIRH